MLCEAGVPARLCKADRGSLVVAGAAKEGRRRRRAHQTAAHPGRISVTGAIPSGPKHRKGNLSQGDTLREDYPMSEPRLFLFEPSFNPSVKVQSRDLFEVNRQCRSGPNSLPAAPTARWSEGDFCPSPVV